MPESGMPFAEVNTMYCEHNAKRINTLNGNRASLKGGGKEKQMVQLCTVKTDINRPKIKYWVKGSEYRADWQKSIKEAKIRIGL